MSYEIKKFKCANCGTEVEYPSGMVGTSVIEEPTKCKKCGTSFVYKTT